MKAKTDELIVEAHARREKDDYPDTTTLLRSLPITLRGLCDFVLTEESTKEKIAMALASIIDTIDNAKDKIVQTS